MTRKARALGMTNTIYRNASGLPDSAQVTTARDQAMLGRAIQERFPRYYRYFSTRTFTFRGQRIGNHNRLLGRVEGVDGIKTGYIRASGFNLVTSVQARQPPRRRGRARRHQRRRARRAHAPAARAARRQRLDPPHRADDRRSAGARHAGAARPRRTAETAPTRHATGTPGVDRYEMRERRATCRRGSQRRPAAAAPQPAPAAGSTEPIRPVAVRTVSVKPAPTRPLGRASALRSPSRRRPLPLHAPRARRRPAPARAGFLGVLPAHRRRQRSGAAPVRAGPVREPRRA